MIMYQWVMVALESQSGGGAKLLRFARFARVMKLLRLTKLQVMFFQVLQRIDNIYVLLLMRLAFYTLGLTFYVHVSGTIWFAIGETNNGWVHQHDGIFATLPLSYIGSFHWAVTQMQGSAEIMPTNLQERTVSSVHYMLSIIVLALFISKLTNVLQAMAFVKGKEQELLWLAYTFMKSNKIGVELRMRVQRFLNDKASVGKKKKEIAQQNVLMSILPISLCQALILEVRVPAVSHSLLMASLLRYQSAFAAQKPPFRPPSKPS